MLLFTYVALSILLYWIHLHCISRLYDPQKGILQHYGQILCHWMDIFQEFSVFKFFTVYKRLGVGVTAKNTLPMAPKYEFCFIDRHKLW